MSPKDRSASDPASRFGLVIVAHGELAAVLSRLLERILSAPAGIETVSVDWDDNVEDAGRRVAEAVDRAETGRGVLVLTDMFGGTPTNVALSLLKRGNVEIVTGVNLPMVVKAPTARMAPGSLKDAADTLRDAGQRAIQLATHYLEKPGGKPSA